MDKFWWLTLGLLIGWLAHWLFNMLFCKCKCTNEDCSKHGTGNTRTPLYTPNKSTLSDSTIPTLTNALPAVAPVVAAAAVVIPSQFLTKDGQDDLQVIEGIGPKIAELLHAAGINRFQQLATTPVATLDGILKNGGSHFQLANPATWPEQAGLIVKGDIAGFERLIGELKGGVRQ